MFKKIFITIAFLILISIPIVGFAQVNVGENYAANIGLGAKNPREIAAKVVNISLGFLSIVAVFIILYGGYLWMTSQGEQDKVEKAKKVLTSAVIGLIIILSAWAIAWFIISRMLQATKLGPPTNPKPSQGYISALGAGIIQSVYPEPDQRNVPRNTFIAVTFKREINPNTICNTTIENGTAKCNGGLIKAKNIRVFINNMGDQCNGSPLNCDNNITQIKAFSNDNKTFVFKPIKYLGSPSEKIWYSVKLMDNIKLKDGANIDLGIDGYYQWKFEVSTFLDLTPPKVKSVFPYPDNKQDQEKLVSNAVAATGAIEVINQPNYYKAAIVGNAVPQGDSESATVSGKYSCLSDGTITVTINNGSASSTSNSEQINIGLIDDPNLEDGVVSIGCGLSLTTDGDFTQGNQWKIEVTAEVQPTTLSINDKTYTFVKGNVKDNEIEVGSDKNSTAKNISNKINQNLSSLLSAKSTDNKVNLIAKVLGKAGNRISLTTNNTDKLKITNMANGSDKVSVINVKDQPDQPINSIVQINFTEAINPVAISGKTSEIANSLRIVNNLKTNNNDCVQDTECASGSCVDGKCSNGIDTLKSNGENCASNRECLSFNCNDKGKCVGNYLSGEFKISNQYKTTEFFSNNNCSVNACGDKIYCLPPFSNLKVIIKAANLKTCNNNSDCTDGSYPNCLKSGNINVCQSKENINYPSSDMTNISSGVMDMAANSLDGNKDNNAQGPKSQSGKPAYNENEIFADCASGENIGKSCNNDNATTVCGNTSKCQYPDGNQAEALLVRESELQKNEGDDYQWSFWISDKVDVSSPIIKEISPDIGASGVSTTDPVIIKFSKLMSSSTLKPGVGYGEYYKDGKEKEFLIFINNTTEPLGYWVYKEDLDEAPLDGFKDRTRVIIKHSPLIEAKYNFLVGSGVEDIYQNCYNPANGPGCSNLSNGISCCNGNAKSSADQYCYPAK